MVEARQEISPPFTKAMAKLHLESTQNKSDKVINLKKKEGGKRRMEEKQLPRKLEFTVTNVKPTWSSPSLSQKKQTTNFFVHF